MSQLGGSQDRLCPMSRTNNAILSNFRSAVIENQTRLEMLYQTKEILLVRSMKWRNYHIPALN